MVVEKRQWEILKKMRMIHWMVVAGLVVSVGMLSTGTVFAQLGATRNSWFPQNNPPPISAWLELERVSSSQLDSYNQYVRPQLAMERLLTAQRREMNRQMDQQKTMQKELSLVRDFRPPSPSYQIQFEASPTGKGAGYGNYLHYYQQRRR